MITLENGMLKELVSTAFSTTLYLESIRQQKLNVLVESQEEQLSLVTRTSKLFFSSPDTPLLYCVSQIKKQLLTKEEYQLIAAQKLPLGSIFSRLHHSSVIFKKNITAEICRFEQEAAQMKLQSPELYRKSYDFLIGARKVAVISEFFSKESLERI